MKGDSGFRLCLHCSTSNEIVAVNELELQDGEGWNTSIATPSIACHQPRICTVELNITDLQDSSGAIVARGSVILRSVGGLRGTNHDVPVEAEFELQPFMAPPNNTSDNSTSPLSDGIAFSSNKETFTSVALISGMAVMIQSIWIITVYRYRKSKSDYQPDV